jgi:predicted  nucleic acid-binding Zn-ribbon protein
MSAALQGLLALQDLDIVLDQLRHRQAHLPERAELAGIDADMDACRKELAELGSLSGGLAERQSAAEVELAATEQRAGSVSRRLYGGDVSASRDLQALSDELAHLKARASGLEDVVIGLMDERQPLDARAAELAGELSALTGRRLDTADRLARAEEALRTEQADTQARRTEAAATVAPPLLGTYERLRGRLGGVGVARLVGNHCDGCHLTLSAAELDHVRHLADGEVYSCEQCSRILVP